MTHLRGGSWINNQDNARAVYRNNNHPANRNNNIGFRVVVSRPTPPSLFKGKSARADFCAGQITFAEFDASVQGWINHVRYADTWGLRTYVLGKGLAFQKPTS